MNDSPPDPPSGYDVPPELPDAKPWMAPVPHGYDAPPDLSEAAGSRQAPAPTGDDEHALDGGIESPVREETPLVPSVGAADAATPSRFDLKSMGQEFIDGEKNQPGRRVEIGGQAAEVKDKEWLRAKTNEGRAEKGQDPISKERWEQAWNEQKLAATEYMGEERAAQHQVGFEKGVDANGQANAKLTGDSVRADGKHIFVMDGEGEVYAKEEGEAHAQSDQHDRAVHVHHSSFKSGEAVAGAGEMTVDDEGFLKEVTDRSGHYRPGEAQTAQTLEHLEQTKGVNLDNTKFTMDRGDAEEDKTRGMAKEFLQGKVTPEEKAHRDQKLADGGELKTDVGSAMEKTFRGRHGVADEVKSKLESVREVLDQDADRRAARVELADEYLSKGTDYGKVSRAVGRSAEQAEVKLEQKVPSVREALGKHNEGPKPTVSPRLGL